MFWILSEMYNACDCVKLSLKIDKIFSLKLDLYMLSTVHFTYMHIIMYALVSLFECLIWTLQQIWPNLMQNPLNC